MVNITEDIIRIIKQSLEPTDIWDIEELAEEVSNRLSPSEVFSNDELEEWAEDEGYVLQEDME